MHAASVHPEPGSNSRMFCIISLSQALQSSSSFSLLFYFYFVCVFSLEFVRVLLRTFVFALYFSQADSLCFVVQFSMTGACSFPPGAVSVLRRLDYYITSHPACQAFFQTFSDFFSRLFLRSRVRFVRSLSLFPTAPILYPFSSPLSTLFFRQHGTKAKY